MPNNSIVKYWDYLKEYSAHREEYLRVVDNVFSSGRLVLGSQVDLFEKMFATYCGATSAIGVNSGTDAIFLALKALHIGPGDEVITVSNTAVPTVAAIRAAGATPVFVDVEEDTYLMDIKHVESKVSERTRCIVPVHLCGQMTDMLPLTNLSIKKNISIVEDCAQACGAMYMGRRAGSIGDIGAFSFYPTKILGAFGDGGCLVTSNGNLGNMLRRLRFYGMEAEYYSLEEGYNSRLDEIQAAILNMKLSSVDINVLKRQNIAMIYNEGLEGVGDIGLPVTRKQRTHQYYLYTIRTGHRAELIEYLSKEGIETKINYPHPIHLMSGYSFLGYRSGDLPATELLARTIVSLPIYPEMPEEDAFRVIDAIQRFFKVGTL